MPVYKSRIRFQGRKERAKQDNSGQAQCKPFNNTHSGSSDSTVCKNVIHEESLFSKKRIASIDELGKFLRSNLTSSLAAVKASAVEHGVACSTSTLTLLHDERTQDDDDDDDDPPASFLELAPIYYSVNDCLEPTGGCAVIDEHACKGNEPLASLLATAEVCTPVVDGLHKPSVTTPVTAIYRPNDDQLERANSCAISHEGRSAGSPTSSQPVAADILVPVDDHLEKKEQTLSFSLAAADACAAQYDNDPPASLLVETRESFIAYIMPPLQSFAVPLQSQEYHATFLKKMVTLFAGRPPCPVISEQLPGALDLAKVQRPLANTSSQLHIPPRLSTDSLYLLPRKSVPREKLPLPPPVLATRRPHCPNKENLDQPFILPAKEHKYTGKYSVVPDHFEPAEIHLGFTPPTGIISPAFAKGGQNSATTLLDRDDTAWGRWYAKTSRPEALPFAKVKSAGERPDQLATEVTEQQVWDAHAASLEQVQKYNEKCKPQDAEDEEQERAARLRNHQEHCFGAITGDVYPFRHGLIQ